MFLHNARVFGGDARSELQNLLHKRRQRSPWNVVGVVSGCFWPPLLFAFVYFQVAFWFRVYHPFLTFLFAPCLGTLICVLVTAHAVKRYRHKSHCREAICLAVVLWVALVLGLSLADRTFWWDSWTYYSFEELASYTDIDPSADKGQSYMDAGEVYFKEGSIVSVDKAMAFRNGGVYCVAPIVRQTLDNVDNGQKKGAAAYRVPISGTVDWWAVGKDCCDAATGKNFTCHHAANSRARSAIRMLNEEERLFYLMAVQEWSAWLHLPSKHPLFFYWVQDPLEEVDRYYSRSRKRFLAHTLVFCLISLLLTLILLFVLARSGIW